MSKKPRPKKVKKPAEPPLVQEPVPLAMVDGRYPIHKIDRIDAVFPAQVTHLMPEYDPEYKSARWSMKLASKWFGEGLEQKDLPEPKEWVNLTEALAHLSAVLRSFQHKHERKMQAAERLLENWFNEPKEASHDAG